MKKQLLGICFTLNCIFLLAQGPIKNNGFENWTQVSYENLKYYTTSEQENFQKDPFFIHLGEQKSTDAQNGQFAITVTTWANGKDTVPGFFANGDPGKQRGGFPYTERPTALTGYYKGAIMPNDTGLIIVMFKKLGNIIGFNVKKIDGATPSYTAFSLPMVFPPIITPDTVIIAVTSSNVINSNGIPGSTLTCDNFMFDGVVNQPANFNGDFENWQTLTFDELTDWNTSRSAEKTTDRHSGQFAASVKTELNDGNNVEAGILSNAKWMSNGSNGQYQGRPYTLTKDTLVGWYKYIPVGADSASVNISLTNSGMPVGGVNATLPPASTYTYFSIPFTGTLPDSIGVWLSSANGNPALANIGSELFVDDVYLKSQLLTLTPTITNPSCKGFGNGLADVAVSGGVAPYNFDWWVDGVLYQNWGSLYNPLSAGTYTVVVTDFNGTTGTLEITLTDPDGIIPVTTSTPATCNVNDGAASVSATGGAIPYTYLWSSGSTTTSEAGLGAGSYTVEVDDANACAVTTVALVGNANAPILTVSKTDIKCNGLSSGAISVSAAGGTGSLTYSWSIDSTSTTVSNLQAGSYYLTVNDASNCVSLTRVDLLEPLVLDAVTNIEANPSCFGSGDASASVTVTGGVSAYTYKWSNGGTSSTISNVLADSYTVTVTDANACEVTAVQLIQDAAAISVNIFPDAITCNGGTTTATAYASGGGASFSYSWNTTDSTDFVTGLFANTYTVTVTDTKGCTGSTSVTITEPDAITVLMTAVDITCFGNTDGAATATATGGNGGFNYAWDGGDMIPAISGLGAGTYTVTVTDFTACSATTEVTLTAPPALGLTISATGNSATASVTGGSTPYTYSWSTNETGQTVSGLADDTYTVTVTDKNGCLTSGTVVILTTAINGKGASSLGFTLYPNPASEQLFIQTKLSSSSVMSIRNVMGQIVQNEILQTGTLSSVNISMLPVGMYTIELTQGNTRSLKKFTKVD